MSSCTVLRNGFVYDGFGRPPFRADVMLCDDIIMQIGDVDAPDRAEILDLDGLAMAPGFIDVHSHSDYTLVVDPRAVSSIAQGVTTEIVGNCGHGCAPLLSKRFAHCAVYGPINRHPAPLWSMAEYLAAIDRARPAVNVLMLVPNGQLRLGVVGLEPRPATAHERDAMIEHLETALDQGAGGFSSGLEYAQERGAPEAEIVALATAAARRGGIYTTHARDRDAGAVEGVGEAIRTAEKAGIQLQISHITPRAGQDVIDRCLELALEARRRGLPVGFDMHTRLFGFTHLKNVVPTAALEGSGEVVRARLRDPGSRAGFRQFRNVIASVGDWEKVVLVRSASYPEFVGLPFPRIGEALGLDPHDAAFEVLAADADDLLFPMIILNTYTEDKLRRTYLADDCMIGSDATALAPDGPLRDEVFYGAYSWAAWFWRRMVRETGAFSPEAAIHRMTGLPARVFGLTDRGTIVQGAKADLVVFDPDRFSEKATLAEPNILAEGMVHVFVNGVCTLRDGRLTGQRGGAVLSRTGA
jgi:N-acyl-D-amino-acid deacylase